MSAVFRSSAGLVFLAGVIVGAVAIGFAGHAGWSSAQAEEAPAEAGASGNWAIAPVGDNWSYCWVMSPEGKLYTVHADRRMEDLEVKGVLDLAAKKEQ